MYRRIPDRRPVSGGWFLYAIQHEPANPTWVGDYPEVGDVERRRSPAQNAYYLTVNLFNGVTLGFQGVRVFALDRASMLTGGAASTVALTSPLPAWRFLQSGSSWFSRWQPTACGQG